MQGKVQSIQEAAANKQSSHVLKTANQINGRKLSNKATLKATSQEERLSKWKNQFQQLLGSAPNVSDTEIEKIAENLLNIKLGNFTKEELDAVLRRIKIRKKQRENRKDIQSL